MLPLDTATPGGRAEEPVLLVIVGALGDLAWRKFIHDARQVAKEAGKLNDGSDRVEIRLVDQAWTSPKWQQAGGGLEQELRYRIARRLIERCAEGIKEWEIVPDEDKDGKLTNRPRVLRNDLSHEPLPWDVSTFYGEWIDTQTSPQARASGCSIPVLDEMESDLDEKIAWFIPRYGSDRSSKDRWLSEAKRQERKVAVFVATPPQAYPDVLREWAIRADRIVLEKPAVGIDAGTLQYKGTAALKAAVAKVQGQLITNDHYNAKLVTRAMDRIRDYHLFDHLLTPDRIARIVVELIELAPLPLGRCNFYNGAGGAFGDMVPHLLQAVRALLGKQRLGDLEIEFGGPEDFCWARYDGSSSAATFQRPTSRPHSYEPHYYQGLHGETETYVAFKGHVQTGGRLIDLWCRTGKGLQPRKSIRVDCIYDAVSKKEVSLIFDFDKSTFSLRDDPGHFVFESGKLRVAEESRAGVPAASEYRGIFESIVHTPWNQPLDERYFPNVDDAMALADKVIRTLERARQNRAVRSYDVGAFTAALPWRDTEARWS